MKGCSWVVVSGLLLAFSGCDPGYVLRLEQPIPRPPDEVCIRQALRDSDVVAVVTPLPDMPDSQVAVAVLDSAAQRGRWEFRLSLVEHADSTGLLRIRYMWIGNASTVPEAEQRAMVAKAEIVLDDLRSRCAPDAKPQVTCKAQGLGTPLVCKE